jgi:hypothetical protein
VSWLKFVRERYAFVIDLDDAEQRVVRCSPGDDYVVQRMVNLVSESGDG